MRVKIFDSEDKAKDILANNKPRLIRAGGKEICIVRKGDELFAFQNACAHMGQNLHEGTTNYLNEIVCPLHTFRFNMKTGEEANRRCLSIKIYSVKYLTDGIFIDI